MPYNIQFQIAGLFLVCLTGLLLLGKRAVRLYTQKTYIFLFAAVTVSICLDILSVIFAVEKEKAGDIVVHFICKAYLLSIIIVAFSLWQYIFTEVHKGIRHKKLFYSLGLFPLLAQLLVLIFFPIKIFHSGMKLYTYGICVSLTYVFAFVYLAASIVYTVIHKKDMRQAACKSICFLIGAWISAALVQMARNEFLIVSFAMGLAMIYMYIKMENPQSYIDNESQTFNAYAYTEYLQKIVGSEKKIWVISVRVDGIHFVNENFGFSHGRKLLRQVVQFFRQTGDKRTVVFHTSSCSFAIFYEEEQAMLSAVDKIEARFEETWQVEDLSLNLDYKMAYLADSTQMTSVNELIDVLDYFVEDENTGVRIDEKAISERNRKVEVEKALQWALENDGIQVYYQPIYSIAEKRVCALEALVRVTDEEGRMFFPDTFIPLAEKNGMILKLGNIVLGKVCEFMQTKQIEQLGIEYVEVNLSVVQCMQEDLPKQFLDIMAEKQVPPYRINLEITETAAVNSEKILLRNMEKMIRVGINFSLDDYGSGYSSLSYVMQLPVKIIKLDKELVWSYFTNKKSAIAMKHEVSMLHELGLVIVAEGVENAEQFEAMKELGIDQIQGYYFSKPVPPQALLALLKDWQ